MCFAIVWRRYRIRIRAYQNVGKAMRILKSRLDYLNILLWNTSKNVHAMQNWLRDRIIDKYFVAHGENDVNAKTRAFVEVDK